MDIVNNSVLIVPSSIRKKILLNLSKKQELYNIKFMSLQEVIDALSFNYDEKSICYLMEKYDLKYSNALVYLKNMKYIEDKEYNDEKLDKLVKLKNEIKDLLIYDNLFLNLIKNKKVIVYGYDYIPNYEKKLLKKIANLEIVYEENKDYVHKIYELPTLEQEVEYVALRICDLIKNGVNINNIKVINIDSDYNEVIKKVFKMHNIPLYMKNDSSIFETNICKNFLKLYDEGKNINELNFNEKIREEESIYNKIIDILNKCNFKINKQIKREILINEFKKTKISTNRLVNAVDITSIDEIKEDDYVFMLNFNQESTPIIYKDEDYLSDKLKEKLGLEKSYELNKIERIKLINKIRNIKNLEITYKLKSSFKIFYASSIIKSLEYEVIKIDKFNNYCSSIYNKIKLTKKLDNYIKYGESSSDLKLLYSNYKSIGYNSYNNKFKGIDKERLIKHLDNNLLLSYTSMDNYFKCKFKYYISNILKINEREKTFAETIGNIFHYILSICFNQEFDLDYEFEKCLKDYDLTPMNRFFLKKLKEELKFIIETIKKQYSHSKLDKSLYENEINITSEFNNVTVTFKGFVDKILYTKENNQTLLVIIDYKTGNPELNLNNSVYGLNLQLPVYLFLAKNSKEIENAQVIGFYLQKILNTEVCIDGKNSYKTQKEENLKLQGFSIENENLLYLFDDSYKNSDVIKSMKVNKDGFSKFSKILSEKNMDQLYAIVDEKIKEAVEGITKADFSINPKKIGFNNISCGFCKYKDICFKKEEDIMILKEIKDLEFLK